MGSGAGLLDCNIEFITLLTSLVIDELCDKLLPLMVETPKSGAFTWLPFALFPNVPLRFRSYSDPKASEVAEIFTERFAI